jgi:hypothetical protein
VSLLLTQKSSVVCASAVSDPRADERVGGVDLDSMSERQLERLHAGLLKLAALPDEELRALIGSLLESEAEA